METRNYYEEIQGLMERAGRFQPTLNELFSLCQRYYWKWLIKDNMKSADTVLKYCRDKDEQLTEKKTKKRTQENSKERLELDEKLYLEFLWEIGDRYYPKQNILDIYTSINGKKNISKCFTKEPHDLLICIDAIWKKADELKNYNYIWKRQDFSSIHTAMDSVRKVLNTPVPSIAESVDKVIAREQLDIIKSALEADRVEIALFTVAPIARALYDGDYATYSYDDKNRIKYFNIKGEYNFIQLCTYIDSINALVSRYDDTMADIESYRSTFK